MMTAETMLSKRPILKIRFIFIVFINITPFSGVTVMLRVIWKQRHCFDQRVVSWLFVLHSSWCC